MGRREQNDGSLFEEMDGPYLVAFGNWLTESLDASELSAEQVLLLLMVLDRCLHALWRLFPEVLMPYMTRMLTLMEERDDEDE
jgi:hypothetical protein